MRSTDRDKTGTVTFGDRIVDGASGAGVSQPGNIPYSWSRVATGQYNVRFDVRLTPVVVMASGADNQGAIGAPTTGVPGLFNIYLLSTAGVGVNANSRWTCTALDKRT